MPKITPDNIVAFSEGGGQASFLAKIVLHWQPITINVEPISELKTPGPYLLPLENFMAQRKKKVI